MSEPRKEELYGSARDQIATLTRDLRDPVAAMASACAVIHQLLPYASWTGFYRVVEPELLRIGPYQGPVGCLEIPFGQGVCGVAAQRRKTLIVEDVHAIPGHIACDPDSRSEIDLPVFDRDDQLCAVLDLDSRQEAAFDEADRAGLEAIAELLRPCVAPDGA